MLRRIAALTLFARVLSAQDSVLLEGRYWIPRFSSQLRVEHDGIGTLLDAKHDLGIPNTNFPAGSVTWQHHRSRLSFSYTPIDLSGDQNVTQTVMFGGRSYTVGTRIQSELAIQHLQLSWSYDLVRAADGKFRLGPVVEADGFLMHSRLTAPALTPAISQTEDLSIGVPAVGLAAIYSPRKSIDLYGQAAGMDVGGYGSFVGSDAGVRVRPWSRLVLSAGYRTFRLHAANSLDFFHVEFHGPFVGAGFQF